MIIQKIKTFLRPLKKAIIKSPDRFLKPVSGVIHVGANLGQERELYRKYGLRVLWIEPIPEVFAQLTVNIQNFQNQQAIQALVTDMDDHEYEFHIANNEGESSSIFEFKEHKDIWPNIDYTHSIQIKSITLPNLLAKEQIDLRQYQALVLDTQGSELLILQGSLPILKYFKFIKTEVTDFESYANSCQLSDVNDFMIQQGYREFSRYQFANRSQGGSYFDIVYKKRFAFGISRLWS